MRVEGLNVESIEPVRIETERIGAYRVITDTEQIAQVLTQSWPTQGHGQPHMAALRSVKAGLEGKKRADLVRKAFIRAAQAAGIYVDEPKRSRG